MDQFYQLNHKQWQVPPFTAQQLRPKASNILVCICVINEGSRIRNQLTKMAAGHYGCDILIADGGSTDGSLETTFLAEHGVNYLLTKKGPGKLSAQMRMAMAFGIENGYEGMVFVDGNDKDDTSAIPQFAKLLQQGYDHVQGSRYIPGGKAINTPFMRHLGLVILHAPLIGLSAGFRYTDTTNGFRGYSARFLADPRVNPFRDVFFAYELHYYLAIRAPRLGYKTIETPVTRAYPKGKVPSKISSFKGNFNILKTLFKAAFRMWDEPAAKK